jgi:hypothetical protein
MRDADSQGKAKGRGEALGEKGEGEKGEGRREKSKSKGISKG